MIQNSLRKTGLRLIAAAALFLGAASADAQQPPPDPLKPARDVLEQIAKKDFRKAKQAADAVQDPFVKKAMLWFLLPAKDAPASFAELAPLVISLKGWPGLGRLIERTEQSIGANEDAAAVIAYFKQVPPAGTAGWMNYAGALMRAGDEAGAAQVARQAWAAAAMNPAEEGVFLRRFGRLLTPEDDRARLGMLLRTRRTEAAQALLGRAILPAEEKVAAVLRIVMQAGTSLPADVEPQLAKLPESIRGDDDLRLDELRWHLRADRHEAAGRILEKPPAAFDDPRPWYRDGNRGVRALLDAGKVDEAYRAAAGFAHTTGELMATMEFLAGWIALRKQNKPVVALAHFERLYAGTAAAISRARGAYWAARAAAAKGDAATAELWYIRAAGYPHVFYGQLAVAALGRASLTLPADIAADPVMLKALADEELGRAAALFAALGEGDAAHQFLLRLSMDATEPERWAAIAHFAASAGIDRRAVAVRAARRASLRSIPLYAFGYPLIDLPLDSPVEAALALSIIRQESEFHLAAVSSSGARGLMQLMPATAREVAQQLKLPYDLAKLTSDETYNMRLGTRFLGRLVERYGGSYPMAAAAYNAGPGNLNKWLARYGDPRKDGIDLVDWIESIPFDETRNYVHRVMENLAVYRHRAGLRSLAAEPGALWRPPDGDALKLPASPPPLP